MLLEGIYFCREAIVAAGGPMVSARALCLQRRSISTGEI